MSKLPKPPPNSPVTTLKGLDREAREMLTPKGVDGKRLPDPPASPPRKVRIAKDGTATVKQGYVVAPLDNPLWELGAALKVIPDTAGKVTKVLASPITGLAHRLSPELAKARLYKDLGPKYSVERAAAEVALRMDKKQNLLNAVPEGYASRVISSGPASRVMDFVDAERASHLERYRRVRNRRAAAALSLGALAAAGLAGMS